MARNRKNDDDDDDDDLPRSKRRRRDEDEEDDAEEEERPRPKPKKVKKRNPNAMRGIGIVFGAIFGGLLLIYLIYWTYSPAGYDKDLAACMPEGINGYLQVDYASVSRLITDLKSGHDNFMGGPGSEDVKRAIKAVNMKETDVEVFAMGEVPKTAQGNPFKGRVYAFRFNDDIDVDKFAANAKLEKTRDFYGKNVTYRDFSGVQQEEFYYSNNDCYLFPKKNIMVYSPSPQAFWFVLNQSCKKPNINPEMLSLMSRGDGHAFYVTTDTSEDHPGDPTSAFPGINGINPNTLSGKLVWIASNGSQVKIGCQLEFKDSSTAADVYRATREKYADVKKEIIEAEYKYEGIKSLKPFCRPKDSGGGFAPPTPGQGQQKAEANYETEVLNAAGEFIAQSAFTQAKVSRSGNRVLVVGTISADTAEKGAQKAPLFRTGFGAGGGGGPAMPPPPSGGPR